MCSPGSRPAAGTAPTPNDDVAPTTLHIGAIKNDPFKKTGREQLVSSFRTPPSPLNIAGGGPPGLRI